MKNQYFGDVNDYRKYSLLRILANKGQIHTAVCWMLTGADNRPDGKFINYLQEPDQWRCCDPDLFDSLSRCLTNPSNRHVGWVEAEGLLPGGVFYDKLLTDNAGERQQYFLQFLTLAAGYDLVFFDPDNGLEVKSAPYGRKNSCKYLYWSELQATVQAGHSVCVYQHFPRVKRDEFDVKKSREICVQTGLAELLSFRTHNVVFFLIPQPDSFDYFQQRGRAVIEQWGSEIQVQRIQET